MAKTIKITLYSPNELWAKFCNWVFWPRRKQCSDWLDLLRVKLENEIISKMLIDKYNAGVIGEDLVDDLDLEIKAIIRREIDRMKEVMSEPF